MTSAAMPRDAFRALELGTARKEDPMSSTSFLKRQKERARQEKQKEKSVKRDERKKDKGDKADVAPGEDPDLAGIIPGPQPILE